MCSPLWDMSEALPCPESVFTSDGRSSDDPDSDEVITPGAPNLTVPASLDPCSIPTLSTWGLIALTAILLAVGSAMIFRRGAITV